MAGVYSGCDTDNLHELNINPQAVNEIDLHYMFSAAQLGIASNGTSGDNRYTDWRTNIGMCATAIQQLATTGNISAAGMYYRHNEETSAAMFDFIYNDQLKNIAEVLRQTGPGGYADGQLLNVRNASRILRAWSFLRLTDLYGAIPYTEANQGLTGIFFPAYDNQSDIYADLLKELDEASAAISAANIDASFAASDMIYQGDLDKWKKFGYSLMLRAAMRVSNVDAAMAASYVAKAVAGGVFQSNADNVWIPMRVGPSLWTNQNGISRAFLPGDGGNDSFLSEKLVNFLKGANKAVTADDDPRLKIFTAGIGYWTSTGFTPQPGKTDPLKQLGMRSGTYFQTQNAILGVTDHIDDTTYSRIHPNMLDRDDPYMIMNYAEVKFLLAEAAQRGIGGVTGAQAHYNAGVEAAMQMYLPYFANNAGDNSAVVTPAQVTAYLAAYPYGAGGVTGTESALEQIGYQMWASKFLNWWEAWADWRRTGFPTLVAFTDDPNNVTGGTIPVRLRYPTSETVANPAFDQEDKNNYTTPVWWDGGSE